MNKIEKIKEIIITYGQIDGDHHKAWIIDQIVRVIEENNYYKFVHDYEYTNDNGNKTKKPEYYWNKGIAP